MEKDGYREESDSSGGNVSRDKTFLVKYKSENKHLRNILHAKGLSSSRMLAERQRASWWSSLMYAAGKELQPMLAYPFEHLKEVIAAGGSAEGLKLDFYYDPNSSGDVDCIFLDTQFDITESKPDAMSTPMKAPQVMMEEDQNHPGYVKLKVPKHLAGHKDYKQFTKSFGDDVYLTGKQNLSKCVEFLSCFTQNIEIHGPAVTYNLDFIAAKKLLHFLAKGDTGGFDHTYLELGVLNDRKYSTDLVFCHFYNGWPQQAGGWIERQSNSNWPPKPLKELCVEKGCILAPVSPKDSPDKDIFWRISFNKAEQLLIESFNETQFHCLAMLKFLKTEAMTEIPGKNITSYTMKTTMFWCMEEVNQTEWRPDNLIQCFIACLELLRKWIADRYMPNYFIEKRNLFDYSELSESIRSQLISVLDTVISNPWQEIRTLTPLEDLMEKKEDELALRTVKNDIGHCIAFRTNVAMGYRLFGSTHNMVTAATKNVSISLANQNSANASYREIIRRALGCHYNVRTMPVPGKLPYDCLGFITKVLDEDGPNLGQKFIELDQKVKKENRFEILDTYREILLKDLVEDDLSRTIEALRGATDEDDDLGQAFAAHLHCLDDPRFGNK